VFNPVWRNTIFCNSEKKFSNNVTLDMKWVYVNMTGYCFTERPSSLRIENVTPPKRLLGTEGQDLTVSCKAVGGTPAPNVILIVDGQSAANQTQTAQHTLTAINRSYDRKTVTCQSSYPAYLQNSLTDAAVIYLNCK
jgi:hypothetical protein